MTRAFKIAKGLSALTLLVLLVAGVPWALWHYVGWPLPHSLPRWSQFTAGLDRHGISDRVLLDALACVVWITWAILAASVIAEVPAAIRGCRPRRLAVAGPLQPLVSHLVAAVLVAALALPPRPVGGTGRVPLSSSLAVVRPRQPALTMALVSDNRRPSTSPGADGHTPGDRASGSTDYVVQRGDTLWGIAERHLGDPLRWREIYALNNRRPEPDGRILDDPNWIYPGWTVVLPADATGLTPTGAHQVAPVKRRRSPQSRHRTVSPTTAPSTRESRPAPTTTPEPTSPTRRAPPGRDHEPGASHVGGSGRGPRSPASVPIAPIGLGLLGAGLLASLVQLRRVQQRHRRPGRRIALSTGELAGLEMALHVGSDLLAAQRVDRAIRLLGRVTVGAKEIPTVLGAVLGRDRFEFLLEDPLPALAPFTNTSPDRWSLERRDRSVERALRAAGGEPSVLPALVTTGEDDEGLVLLNLEAGGRIAIAGDESVATEIATALALELSTASWVECCELYDVGVGTGQANPNRCTTLGSLEQALPAIAGQHEIMAGQLAGTGLPSAAEARLESASEQWSALVVVSNAPATPDEQCAIDHLDEPERHGLVVLAPGPSASARWQLVAHADGTLELPMLSRRVTAQRVSRGHLAGIGALLGLAAARVDVAPDSAPYDAIEFPEMPGVDSPHEATTSSKQEPEEPPVEAGGESELDEPAMSEPFRSAEAELLSRTASSDDRGAEDPIAFGAPKMFGDDELSGLNLAKASDAIGPTGMGLGAASAGQVEVNVLGPVEFSGLAQEPIRSKVAELIVWLALHRKGASIDTIDCMLSPSGRYNDKTLRNYRYEARRCLGKGDATGEHRLTERNGLVVGSELTSDWERFSVLARSADRAARHEALSLVRGRPFGEADWPWLMTEGFSPQMDAAVTDLAGEVALEEIAAHDYSAALRAAEQGLLANPYDERLYRIVMEAHHGAGNPSGVRSTMRRLTTVLEDDVEPFESIHAETRALYEALTSGLRAPLGDSNNPPNDGGVRRLA